jgi:prophage regulatory protein
MTDAATPPAMEKDRRQDSLLRLKDVRRRTGLSPATMYRREAAGTFPPRVRLGPKAVAWYESDVGEFVADPMGYRA